MDTESPNENCILCPSCGKLCSADAQFCPSCRSPITSYASTGPYESIFAEGAAYRSAFNSPSKPIVVIGVWLLFGPAAFSAPIILFDCLPRISEFEVSDICLIILGAVYSLGGGYILYQTTKNYLKNKASHPSDPSDS